MRLMSRVGAAGPGPPQVGPDLRRAEQGDSGGGQRERYERCGDDCGALAVGENVALQAECDDRGRHAQLNGRGEGAGRWAAS